MRLYVGNATKQRVEFMYWIPDRKQSSPSRQTIEVGSQIVVAGSDLNSMQIDGIVAQHVDYGLIEVSQIDKTKVFTGICYSIDKPIPSHRLERLIVLNNDALIIKGRETRKLGAIAEHNRLETLAQQEGLPVPDAYEMGIDEEKTTTRNQPELFSETLNVSRATDGDPAPKVARRRAKAA